MDDESRPQLRHVGVRTESVRAGERERRQDAGDEQTERRRSPAALVWHYYFPTITTTTGPGQGVVQVTHFADFLCGVLCAAGGGRGAGDDPAAAIVFTSPPPLAMRASGC